MAEQQKTNEKNSSVTTKAVTQQITYADEYETINAVVQQIAKERFIPIDKTIFDADGSNMASRISRHIFGIVNELIQHQILLREIELEEKKEVK